MQSFLDAVPLSGYNPIRTELNMPEKPESIEPIASEQAEKQDTIPEANAAGEQKEDELNLEDLDLELKELEEAVAPLALHPVFS
jgi:hypothetical protein